MRIVVERVSAGWNSRRDCRRSSDDIDVVLIDKADGFVFGFSKLDVMFGRQHRYTMRTATWSNRRPLRTACATWSSDTIRSRVDVTFLSGQAPIGDMDGPSEVFARDKVEFGSSRIARWFNPRQ